MDDSVSRQKITYWMDIAEDDLETAEVLLNAQKFLHMGFLCNQTIEKTLKACYVKKFSSTPPFTHNLILLAKESDILNNLSKEHRNLLDLLQPLNIEARYPSYREKLMKDLNLETSSKLLQCTKDLFLWLKSQLSK